MPPPHYVLMADCIYYEQVKFRTLFKNLIISLYHCIFLCDLLLLTSFHTVYCSTGGELEAALWTRHLHYVLL